MSLVSNTLAPRWDDLSLFSVVASSRVPRQVGSSEEVLPPSAVDSYELH